MTTADDRDRAEREAETVPVAALEAAERAGWPAEGWDGPDSRGMMRYTAHGPTGAAPEREGWEPFFIAVHGHRFTTWTYKRSV